MTTKALTDNLTRTQHETTAVSTAFDDGTAHGFNEETLQRFEEFMLEACRIINLTADEKILHHMRRFFRLKAD